MKDNNTMAHRNTNFLSRLFGTTLRVASRKRLGLWAALLTVPTAAIAVGQVQPDGRMMRSPDVSAEKIVFSYGDDLWLVDRAGGVASPLASPPGAENNPRFSPDGKSIAFEGNYEGGRDLYVIPTAGGIAERWTHHPSSERLCDWTPDGSSLLLATNGFAGLSRMNQLFTVSKQQPLPKLLPVPYGENASLSSDGEWLAYIPYGTDQRTWKRYRGGMASDIWLFHLPTKASKRMTDFEGTDSYPMWHGKTVYYLSDAGDTNRLNIWAYNTESGQREAITKYTDYDCKSPSIGPGPNGEGEIIFQKGSQLLLLNLASREAQAVNITIPGDRPTLRPQQVDAAKFVGSASLSPTGQRVVVQARGDIWTLPAKNGSPRNLTNSNGSFERDPAWSPDGRWIAYLSDATGEYELYLTQSDGRGETRQLTKNGSAFRYRPQWSPDSKSIVFGDKTGALFVHQIEAGDTKLVVKDPQGNPMSASWSADSAWLTYSLNPDQRSAGSSIWAYKVADATSLRLTAGFFNDSNPVFDPKGDFLFFSSNRAFNNPQYDDLGTSFIYAGTEVLMAMPLRADVKHPYLPEVDEETWKQDTPADAAKKPDEADKKEEKANPDSSPAQESPQDGDTKPTDDTKPADGDTKPADGDKPKEDKTKESPKPLVIEAEGAETRSFQLPVPQGSFNSLAVNNDGHLLYSRGGSRGSNTPPAIKIFDLKDKEKAEKEVVAGVGRFEISFDRRKLLVSRGDNFYILDAKAGQKLEKEVSTSGMTVVIDPRTEWKQLFWEAWRLERDFFYESTLHGVDWPAIGKQYEALLADCVTRRDVGFVISEMISELNVGHAYYREASLDSGPNNNVGTLGMRLQVEGEAFKIADLYMGAAWDVDARNPLYEAGVRPGQYLLAINHQPLRTQEDPYARLIGSVGQTVMLTVSDQATSGDADKTIAYKVTNSDEDLRFRHWIETKRRYVEEKSGGKVGYVYVVNTGVPGQNDLVRQFYGQIGKEALIIDDRWNGGGQIPTRFIELLNRPVTNYWARRDGTDWTWPPDSHQGPKCMLINGLAGSGGDMFPALFRQNGLGKLIGMRTWGGLVGISGSPGLIDGASVTVPSFGYYRVDGTWGIEGHGVDPDLEVIDDPALMVDGGDPQLDRGIALMLEEIAAKGYRPPQRPTSPNRRGFGIDPKDR
jgi:tricorn protease